MKELTSRQQQAIATKKKIREAAYVLLLNQSFEQLKMSDIAAEASVSVGTLYHHFASKEELLFSGYHEFDLMVEQNQDKLTFSSHIEAIRSIIYGQAGGCILRGIHLMSTALRIQLSAQGSIFLDHGRNFPGYVFSHVQKAIEQGGKLICGGKRKGAYIPPTIISNIPKTADVAIDEEIFGPVVSIIPFSTVKEAIEIANASTFGLCGCVFTKDIKTAFNVVTKLECGGTVINGASFFRSFEQPFGGWKYSGIGNEGIMTTLREMSRTKTVILKNITK